MGGGEGRGGGGISPKANHEKKVSRLADEEKGVPKLNRTQVPLLTNLTATARPNRL